MSKSTITPELVAAALRYWYGDRGTATEGVSHTRYASDGGSYTVTGTRISGGEWGILYVDEKGTGVEFYDGSGGRITDNGDGSWTFHAYDNHAVICPATTATSLECRTGLCTHGTKRD